MKFLIMVIVLFSVQTFAAKTSNVEMKLESIVSLVVAQYNSHPTLESAGKSLFMTDSYRSQVMAELKGQKVLKTAISAVKAEGKIVYFKDSKIDFTDLKKGFVSFNGKQVQINSEKSYKALVQELKSHLNTSSFFNFFPKAYAIGESDAYGWGMLIASAKNHQEKYEVCLEIRKQIDAKLLSKKETAETMDKLNRGLDAGCHLYLPSATLSSVFANGFPQDKVVSMECADGKPKSLKTTNREYTFTGETVKYVHKKIDFKNTCEVDFTCKNSLAGWGSLNCSDPAEEFNEYMQSSNERNIDTAVKSSMFKTCDSDNGYNQIKLIYESVAKCCSDYPDNITSYTVTDRKSTRTVNGKLQVEEVTREVKENFCLALLLLRQEGAGSAGKRQESLKKRSGGNQ